ncbi:MAG TPA: GNAT family N-acetyltransferase [Candidatus Babeliales bacterium]|nr:GNAT family N-acetyltransferase [Candidatus Babeliales bacterium]
MKLKNIIKATIIGSFLYSAAIIQADQDYAKVLFDVPDANLKICAHYDLKDTEFHISLYEAQANNLKNNKYVGYINCNIYTVDNAGRVIAGGPIAFIELLYVDPAVRKKQYGRLIAQLALQECANRGFKKVTFIPQQVDVVKTETLQQMYSAGGSKTGGIWGGMEYDISGFSKIEPEPFKNILPELMY